MQALIAGAGPAGCRLAIRLAHAGWQVSLADPLPDPGWNAYSSAAIPLRDADRLAIPSSCRAARWWGWQLLSPTELDHQWWSSDVLGVVLDFAAFRSWLWDQAIRAGVELLPGRRVQLLQLAAESARVRLQSCGVAHEDRVCTHLIDATGARRVLLRQAGVPMSTAGDPLLTGEGAEWLLQGDDRSTARWRDRLSFMLGSQWIPHGYGWIFPMQRNRLKVGVCRLAPQTASPAGLNTALRRLVNRCGLEGFTVLDRHGGRVSSTVNRRETPGSGSLRAVGDAASTANLLGGEGIRHAMDSADVLAECFLADATVEDYQRRLRQRFGWRWGVSNRLARRTWWGLSNAKADQRMERLISGLSGQASAEALSELLFDYRFERYGWRLLPYLRGSGA